MMDDLPLRDIHLPNAPDWWPPAIGWWLILLFVPLLAWLGVLIYRRRKRQQRVKQARFYLASLRQQSNDAQACIRLLSQWLRRVALSYYPRDEVAGLSGEAWLAFLDHDLADKPFQQGIGRLLLDSQYRPNLPESVDLDGLFSLCERWLQQQQERSS